MKQELLKKQQSKEQPLVLSYKKNINSQLSSLQSDESSNKSSEDLQADNKRNVQEMFNLKATITNVSLIVADKNYNSEEKVLKIKNYLKVQNDSDLPYINSKYVESLYQRDQTQLKKVERKSQTLKQGACFCSQNQEFQKYLKLQYEEWQMEKSQLKEQHRQELQKGLKQLQQTIQYRYQSQMKNLSNKIQQFKKKIQQKDDRIKSQETQLQNLITEHKKSLDQTVLSKKSLEKAVLEFVNKVREQQLKIQELKSSVDFYEENNQELERENNQLKETLQEKQFDIARLGGLDRSVNKKEIVQIRRRSIQQEKLNQNYREQLNEAREATNKYIKAVEIEKQLYEQMLKKKQVELDQLKQKYDQAMEEKKRLLDEEKIKYKTSKKELQGLKEKERMTQSHYEEKIQIITQNYKELQEQLRNIKEIKIKENEEGKLKQIQNQRKKFQQILQDQKEKSTVLEQKLRQNEAKLQDQKEKSTVLEQKLRQNEATINQLQRLTLQSKQTLQFPSSSTSAQFQAESKIKQLTRLIQSLNLKTKQNQAKWREEQSNFQNLVKQLKLQNNKLVNQYQLYVKQQKNEQAKQVKLISNQTSFICSLQSQKYELLDSQAQLLKQNKLIGQQLNDQSKRVRVFIQKEQQLQQKLKSSLQKNAGLELRIAQLQRMISTQRNVSSKKPIEKGHQLSIPLQQSRKEAEFWRQKYQNMLNEVQLLRNQNKQMQKKDKLQNVLVEEIHQLKNQNRKQKRKQKLLEIYKFLNSLKKVLVQKQIQELRLKIGFLLY